MKLHWSVLMLMARSTIHKLLGLFVIMAVAEGVLFALSLCTWLNIGGLELILSHSHITVVCAICFVLVTVLLWTTGCEFSSKQGYTLQRLSVSPRSVFLWQAVYNTICYFLFWAVQTLIVLALCHLYMAVAHEAVVNQQTVFLAFYRNPFLHSLLPLDEAFRYVRNVLLVLSLGVTSAHFPLCQRRRTWSFTAIGMAAATLFLFQGNMGNFDGDSALAVFAVAALVLTIVMGWKEPAYED